MKRLILALSLALCCLAGSSQLYQRIPAYGYDIDRVLPRKALHLPSFTGTPTLDSYQTGIPAIQFKVGDSTGIWLYNPASGGWNRVGGDTTGGWRLTGNTGINPAINGLGTTDNQPLIIKTNNIERMRLLGASGNVGIGTTTPIYNLDVVAPIGVRFKLDSTDAFLQDIKDFNINRKGYEGFSISERAVPIGMPVAYIQPVNDNTQMAFDVYPRGNPNDTFGIGKAWLDIGNADFTNGGTGNTLKAFAGSTYVGIGQSNYGVSAVPLLFWMGDGNTVGQIKTDGNWIINNRLGVGTSSPNFGIQMNNVLGAMFDSVQILSTGSDETSTVVGVNAMGDHSVTFSTAVGYHAAQNIGSAATYTTAVGASSLSSVTSFANTAIGTNSGQFLTNGYRNTALGAWSLGKSAFFTSCTGVGLSSLYNTSGDMNTAIGEQAGAGVTTGSFNTAIGGYSMGRGGFASVFPGTAATTGDYNIANGYTALFNLTSGSRNIAIGLNALNLLRTGNYNTGIGAFTGAGFEDASNRGFWSDGQANIRMYFDSVGNVGIGTTAPIYKLDIAGTGAMRVPVGTTAQRPTANVGAMRYNTDSTSLEFYNGSAWVKVGASTGGGGGSGTVNSGTQYRLAYYATTGTAVSEASAITANRALISDANGVPTHSTVTNTELGYVSGVTSSIQTQINSKLTGTITANQINVGTGVNTTGGTDALKFDGTNLTINSSGSVGAVTLTNGNYDLLIKNAFGPAYFRLLAFDPDIYFGDGAAGSLIFRNAESTSPVELMRVNSTGLGIGVTSPTARLHLAAGTATASTAPLKLTSGTNLSIAEAGAFEYNGTSLFFSPSTTRLRAVLTDNSIPSNGQIPIGNGTNYTNATITAGTGISVTNGAGSVTVATTGFSSGTYTPTVTAVTNTSAVTAGLFHYIVSGSEVSFSGYVNFTTTTAVASEIGISLPGSFTSAFGNANEAAGVGNASSSVGTNGYVQADATNDRLSLKFLGLAVSGTGSIYVTGHYTIILP